MAGRITFMDLRAGWRGFFIFGFLVVIVSAGMPQIFPTARDSFTEELEGENRVDLYLPLEQGGMITLSWESLDNVTGYMVLEDNRLSMVTAKIRYMGKETSITFEKNFEEKRYYAVMGILNESSDPQLIGIVSTVKGEDPFHELLQNPAYAGFTGGRNISILEIKGFIIFEFFSWWWMLAGLFIAYLSVSSIASDFENKRMDVMFSTPISRRCYLVEKFGAMVIYALFIVLVASIGLIGGIASINSLDEFPPVTVLLSLISCLPFLVVIASVGMLTAVIFQKVRIGMGVTFAFLFAEFFLYTFGNFSKNIEWMKVISIFKYWDYTSIIIDDVFKTSDFFVLVLLVSIFFGVAMWIFEKKDILI